MINLSSGGRLSGVVAGVMILLAALVGVMVVVAQQTFAWGLLCVAGKVAVNDVAGDRSGDRHHRNHRPSHGGCNKQEAFLRIARQHHCLVD